MRLADWLQEDGDTLRARYERLYVPRNDPRYLRRNALVALGNTGAPEDAVLAEALRNGDELVREHAEWAAARIEERYAG